ncbi:YWFCY domain-containing protein [Larkinella insperata]|uniref:YWFCY domain-containing protein n=1 Tax=Larkinella insperata TaxID=332158 RepID=A0ABW3QC22_9BACT
MREDRRDQTKANETFLYAAFAVLAFHFYLELYSSFQAFGLSNKYVENALTKLTSRSSLINTPWTLKLVAGVLFVLFASSTRGVKSLKLTRKKVVIDIVVGLGLFLGSTLMLRSYSQWFISLLGLLGTSITYAGLSFVGLLYLIKGVQGVKRLLKVNLGEDHFNDENESFPQEERLLQNEYSINLPTLYQFQKKIRKGWINIVNSFRATMILGTPGSGKTFSVVNPIIRQQLEKGFCMYLYDYKFPSLSLVAFNAMMRHKAKLKGFKFYVVNLDNPANSHRCNPVHPRYMTDVADSNETAKIMMLNLNKKWILKEGDFFVDSAIQYVSAILWFLRNYQGGTYCTFPHLAEMVTQNYRKILPFLKVDPELENLIRPFESAFEGNALEQLEGQIASAQIALTKIISPALYWVLSGDDFGLDINNPDAPKVLCVANNPDREEIYSAALGLINSRLVRLINKPNKLKSSIIIDELPTIYFRGIDRLINTARSNEVAITIAMQDFSQLEKDYGKAEAEVIKNTVGSVICGQVTGSTAKAMQERLGRNVQRKESINIQSEDVTHGISTELNWKVPADKIASLSGGRFVGVFADTFGQETPLKSFHAQVVVDEEDFKKEQKYKKLPNFSIFAKDGENLEKIMRDNYLQIKADVKRIIDSENSRISGK